MEKEHGGNYPLFSACTAVNPQAMRTSAEAMIRRILETEVRRCHLPGPIRDRTHVAVEDEKNHHHHNHHRRRHRHNRHHKQDVASKRPLRFVFLSRHGRLTTSTSMVFFRIEYVDSIFDQRRQFRREHFRHKRGKKGFSCRSVASRPIKRRPVCLRPHHFNVCVFIFWPISPVANSMARYARPRPTSCRTRRSNNRQPAVRQVRRPTGPTTGTRIRNLKIYIYLKKETERQVGW